MKHQVLIAGASGLVGRGALRAFMADPAFDTIAVSRRPPEGIENVRFIAADLFDEDACRETFSHLKAVTHVVFAALYETADPLLASWISPQQIEGNARMLRNLLDPLSSAAQGLQHVALLQGTKAYGAHVRAIPIPAREDRDELKSQPNFYWNQEDYLRAKRQGQSWTFSIHRPQVVCGDAVGGALNPVSALGIYGALLKQRGEPLHFPSAAPPSIFESSDANLVGRAIHWAATQEAGANQTFNVTNGDVMVWRYVWPAIADALGMEVGEVRPMMLADELPKRAGEWDAIRERHHLAAPGLHQYVGKSLEYTDLLLNAGARARGLPPIVSSIKLRQAGFTEMIDSEVMLRNAFKGLQQRKLLPPR